MGKTVHVTRVTLEYAFEGKLWTVQFPDPSRIGSIVFSRIDLERLRQQQKDERGELAPSHILAPNKPFPARIGANDANVFATSEETSTTTVANGTDDRSLWWHSISCSWFHPEEE